MPSGPSGKITPDFHDGRYATPPPWDIGRPQVAFRALADAGAIKGKVLDVGCGTGEHVLMAAALDLDATGVDLVASALQMARDKAYDRGLTARFLQLDARNLASLPQMYDTVLDSGLFHNFEDHDRVAFARSLRSVTAPGGTYFMLCRSDEDQHDPWRPPRMITQDEIRASFAGSWRIDSIESAALEIRESPYRLHAWLAALTRI
jgi:cyclopropane fatty-acyl-phospholipid synthase-like methyltransferase